MYRALSLFTALVFLVSCATSERFAETKTEIKSYRFPQSYKELIANKNIKSKSFDRQYLASEIALKAQHASIRGDHELASILYREVLKLYPKDDYIRQQYGINLIAVGELDEAQKHFKILYTNSKEKDSNLGLVLAGVYIANGETPAAEKVYKTILKKDKANEEACVFLAKSYAKKKDYSKANKILDKCDRVAKKAIYSYYKGKVAIEMSKEKRALKYFLKAIKIDPSFYQAVLGAGLIYESMGEKEKALRVYNKHLSKFGDRYPILSRVVYIYMNDDELAELLPYMERLVAISGDDLNLKVKLGILYTDLNRIDDAKGVFQELLYVAPKSDKILYYLGALYQQTDDFVSAIDYFSKIEPESVLFHDGSLNIGRMLSYKATKGDDKDDFAQKFLSFVDQRSEKHPKLKTPLKVILANYYDDIGETLTAINILESVKSTNEFTTDDHYYLALLHDKEGNVDQTKLALNSIINKNPDNADALNFLGYTLLQEGKDLASAFQYITKAVEIKPLDGYIRDSLGWYYYKTGKYKMALKELKKAWELVQDDVTISKHLGMIYQKIGDYGNARKFFKKALAHCKENGSEKENIQRLLDSVESHKRLPASK